MSYSSIYDLAPIQAVFNCVAPIIEEAFQDTSYGYRWNLDTDDPSRIFEDWNRTSYPRFRNAIMAALRRIPNGYHVCCDIKGFYDHVDHEILVRQIRRLVADDYVYHSIEQVVRSYEFQKGCGQGLPQGPAYARLLANLYLNDFDKAAARITPGYFRYVDNLVLVFTNREDAERGLENLARVLSELHLEFSQDEAKKPAVNVNSDVTRVRKMLDTIQYGILEGTRHLPHLAQQAVKDFGDAIERRNVSPTNLSDLIQINDVLPSLLYVVTQESLNPHPLRKKTCEVSGFLSIATISVQRNSKQSSIHSFSSNGITVLYLKCFETWSQHTRPISCLASSRAGRARPNTVNCLRECYILHRQTMILLFGVLRLQLPPSLASRVTVPFSLVISKKCYRVMPVSSVF